MILVTTYENGSFVINHQPESLGKTELELREIGVLLDGVPEPIQAEGKVSILKFNGTNLYYEYVEIQPTLEDEVQQLKDQVVAQQSAINMLLGV